MLQPEFYMGPMSKGASNAQLIQAHDGKEYVVKFQGNQQGPRVLVNELVCARLAELLDLPVPRSDIMDVRQAFINAETQLSVHGFCGGKQFASEFLKNAHDNPTRDILNRARNKQDLAGLIVFDHWIQNYDRAENPGNLIAVRADSAYDVFLIDHGHAFFGPSWTPYDLSMLDGDHIWGPVYEMLSDHLTAIDLHGWVTKIQNIPGDQIRQVVDSVPQQWLTEQERTVLARTLIGAQSAIIDWLAPLAHIIPGWAQ